MLNRPDKTIRERLAKLEAHIGNENPLLLDVVVRFRKLDRIAYRMGLLETSDSYATRIPWWPLVSILGTFSAGKSSFINHFLGRKLQHTGNQAVDDKFSVICYSSGEDGRVLPGLALDSDPRFPFYQMSDEIEKVTAGEGRRIDAYLQMKTSSSERVSGKIFIDSPGFDADDQRNTILRLTDHIIDLSDLVLVFFDARHPEPGAMHDTLEHLVADTITRNDSEKFLYILNQIDTAAQEDNPEEVVAAWQRALAYKGLTAGRFYTIYNDEAAVPIEDEAVRARFESKRDTDLADIYGRIHQVEVERSYRIIGALDHIATDIEIEVVPQLIEAIKRWRKYVLTLDVLAIGAIFAGLAVLSQSIDVSQLFSLDFVAEPVVSGVKAGVAALVLLAVHYGARNFAAKRVAQTVPEHCSTGNLRQAFIRNTRPMRSVFQPLPAGWTSWTRRILESVKTDASRFVQTMNDRYTSPSGQVAVESEDERAVTSSTDTVSVDDTQTQKEAIT